MTFDEFINKWLGKKVDHDGVYGGQCVDLFRQYIDEVLKLPQPAPVVGARVFWENYDLDKNLYSYYDIIPNTLFAVPKKGDIPIWNEKAGNGFGHVAIVIEANMNSFRSFDQNWPTLDECTITTHNYKNVYGWLRPYVKTEEDDLKKEIAQLKDRVKEMEDPTKFWFDSLKLLDLPSNSKWRIYKTKILSTQKTIEEQRGKITQLEKTITTNVTPLGAERDGKYVYGLTDLFLEAVRRLKDRR